MLSPKDLGLDNPKRVKQAEEAVDAALEKGKKDFKVTNSIFVPWAAVSSLSEAELQDLVNGYQKKGWVVSKSDDTPGQEYGLTFRLPQ